MDPSSRVLIYEQISPLHEEGSQIGLGALPVPV